MKKETIWFNVTATALLFTVFGAAQIFAQGSLTPPGAPAATMKTLTEIEPRTAITSLPYTIAASGSYYLTASLTGTATNGITITADSVTLNLNGFALIGISGSLDGIHSSGKNTVIRNGIVENWEGQGINGLQPSIIVENVQACGNGVNGITGSNYAVIRQCNTYSNGLSGIQVKDGSYVSDCISHDNLQDGVSAASDCRITDVICRKNGDDGISSGAGSLISGCSVISNMYGVYSKEENKIFIENCISRGNTDFGIAVRNESKVIGCTVIYNGNTGIISASKCEVSRCTATHNNGYGITTGTNSKLSDNLCIENGILYNVAGIYADTDTLVENNTVYNSSKGLEINGSGNHLIGNTVKGNTDNYDIAAGNQLELLLCEIPETLDWPCSVKLAGTLKSSVTNQNGITVNSDNVTIDMAGHALIGPGTGETTGIYQDLGLRNLHVYNGKLVNWGGNTPGAAGIHTGINCQLENIQASTNGYYGIHAYLNSTISGCAADYNGNAGFMVYNCVVIDCTANHNKNDGISGSDNIISDCMTDHNQHEGINSYFSAISGCVANNNKNNGINGQTASVISDCTVNYNGYIGISAGDNSTVSGCTATYNEDYNISAGSSCHISGNTCSGTGGNRVGIEVYGKRTRIESNHIANNTWGIKVDDTDNIIMCNTCTGNTSNNYSIVSGNQVGPISTNIVTATSPWANFSF